MAHCWWFCDDVQCILRYAPRLQSAGVELPCWSTDWLLNCNKIDKPLITSITSLLTCFVEAVLDCLIWGSTASKDVIALRVGPVCLASPRLGFVSGPSPTKYNTPNLRLLLTIHLFLLLTTYLLRSRQRPTSILVIGHPLLKIGGQAFTLKWCDAMRCNASSVFWWDDNSILKRLIPAITISMNVRAVLGCLIWESTASAVVKTLLRCVLDQSPETRLKFLVLFTPNTIPQTATYDSPVLVTHNIPIEITAETPSSLIGNPIYYSIGE